MKIVLKYFCYLDIFRDFMINKRYNIKIVFLYFCMIVLFRIKKSNNLIIDYCYGY